MKLLFNHLQVYERNSRAPGPATTPPSAHMASAHAIPLLEHLQNNVLVLVLLFAADRGLIEPFVRSRQKGPT